MSPRSLADACRHILERGDLEGKLAPLPPSLADGDRGDGRPPLRPARAAAIALDAGSDRLPRASALADPAARARCLARFAHHELMAVELFAWALLRWPTLPDALRRGFARVLGDEQRHCRLYLARLAAHGSTLGAHVRSDYFWKHVPALDASPHGPRAFLCAMGLTLEQANLDFSRLYGDGFRGGGDEASARVCEAVHEDEVRHVRLAADWLRRLSPRGWSDARAYTEAVPFPFSAARAKGRRFDARARQRAGLSAAFIEQVRRAGRPSA